MVRSTKKEGEGDLLPIFWQRQRATNIRSDLEVLLMQKCVRLVI